MIVLAIVVSVVLMAAALSFEPLMEFLRRRADRRDAGRRRSQRNRWG